MNASMSTLHLPERELQPPELSREEILDGIAATVDEREVYESAMTMALSGLGEFWSGAWDCEQQYRTHEAIRRALTGIGLTDCEKWAIVFRAVCVEAGKFASGRAEEAT